MSSCRVHSEIEGRRRQGFTLTETLIAVMIFMMVIGISMALFTGMNRDVAKGEDALTSVQDASLILLHLRRDLRRMVFPGEAKPFDLQFIDITGTDFVRDKLRFDPSTRSFTRDQKVSDDVNAVYKEDKTELSFYIYDTDQAGFEQVTFTYLPEQATIVRQVSGQQPRRFALPRLQDFRLQLMVQPERRTPARNVFGDDDETIGPLVQLWFHVQFLVKSERSGVGAETTQVQIETRIFPRQLNRGLNSRWQGDS